MTGVSLRVRKAAPETNREIHRGPTNTATCSTASTAHRTTMPDASDGDGEEDYGAENGDEEEEEDELIPPPPTQFATRATSGVVQGADEEDGDGEETDGRLEDDNFTPNDLEFQV